MEQLTLFCRGLPCGEIILSRGGANGTKWDISAAMDDPGDGLYRAFLLGEAGELPLGVMAPDDNRKLSACRKCYYRDVEKLGKLLQGEARRSFRFQNAAPCWRETHCPAQLFRDNFFVQRLRNQGLAWWRREEDVLLLALPLENGKPFPLDALFCLGCVRCVEGRWCVVYAFKEEEPVLWQDM